MHARSSSCFRVLATAGAAGLALLLLTGCDRGAAVTDADETRPPASPHGASVGPPSPSPQEPPTDPQTDPQAGRTPTPTTSEPTPSGTDSQPGPISVGTSSGDKFVPPPNPNRKPLIEPTLAQITFTSTVRDFGPVTDTAKKQTSFEFVNTGPEPLVIADVKTSCSCTVPRLRKKRFEPGEGGVIDVVFDPKQKSGSVSQEVTIISNSRDGTVKLELSADVRPLIRFDRYARMGVMQLFEEHRIVVPVTYSDADLQFNDISVNDPFITAKLLRSGVPHSGEGDDAVYRADLELTVSRDHPWGGLFARRVALTVTGRWTADAAPIRNKYTVFVLGKVFGDLHADPTVAGFAQTKRHQHIQKVIRITRPSGEPFKLERAWVTDTLKIAPDARIEQLTATDWRVVLTAYTADNLGEIRGTLHISTNVPGEELLQIPISGRVG